MYEEKCASAFGWHASLKLKPHSSTRECIGDWDEELVQWEVAQGAVKLDFPLLGEPWPQDNEVVEWLQGRVNLLGRLLMGKGIRLATFGMWAVKEREVEPQEINKPTTLTWHGTSEKTFMVCKVPHNPRLTRSPYS